MRSLMLLLALIGAGLPVASARQRALREPVFLAGSTRDGQDLRGWLVYFDTTGSPPTILDPPDFWDACSTARAHDEWRIRRHGPYEFKMRGSIDTSGASGWLWRVRKSGNVQAPDSTRVDWRRVRGTHGAPRIEWTVYENLTMDEEKSTLSGATVLLAQTNAGAIGLLAVGRGGVSRVLWMSDIARAKDTLSFDVVDAGVRRTYRADVTARGLVLRRRGDAAASRVELVDDFDAFVQRHSVLDCDQN